MNIADPMFVDGAIHSVEAEVAGTAILFDRRGAIYLPEVGILCVSDLHLEKGSSLARRGVLIPPYDTVATLLRLRGLIDYYRPKIVVSLGDSFHDADGAARLPDRMRDDLSAMMVGREWLWVLGNHDPRPPAGLAGDTVEMLAAGGLTFRHEPSVRSAARPVAGEISGHLHPCARIVQRGRSVRRRCFASDGDRVVMPAFGAYTGSLNVLDRAYAGLFRERGLTAYMIGTSKVFSIPAEMLRPD